MDAGRVRPVTIEEEMRTSYLDYAMSVIVARALPDVRDGLKPVHRRILYAMHELGLRSNGPFRKSAAVVGEVLGKYHPHGDAPVYDAMVRMAQDFNMRYALVDGQGNFGSVDGDRAAAMRYTEARLAAIAEEMLTDIEKNTVGFVPTYDASRTEPAVLPAKVPNLLVNGSSGIAVGMATNIPPHNLGELCDGLSFVIDRYAGCVERGVPFDLVWMRALGLDPELGALVPVVQKLPPALREELAQKAGQSAKRPDRAALAQTLLQWLDDQVDVTPEELSRFIKGPDFPTAGIILGVDGIKNAYATGHGRIVIRARAHVDEPKAGRFQVVVTELPFQVNKAALIEKIADLVRDKRVDGIAELRDESDRQGMRIVIEVKRDAQPRKLLNQLYKHTAMQTAFSVNMLALVDGQPRVLTLKTALLHYVNFRREIVQRRTQFDLEKARQRAHVLEGLKIALDHLDAVIQMIRQARDADAARSALMRQFKLSDAQAQAILDMQLRRLASLERRKILDELKEVRETVAKLEDLLAHPAKILGVVREELQDLKKRFGDVRRTRILQQEVQEFTDEDLIPDVEVVVTVSGRGYVKRLPASTYRVQRRGGRGVTGMVMREDDAVRHVLVANTHDSLLFFTDRGRVFQTKVHELPDASRQARGLPLTNVIGIEANETVTAVMAVRRFLDGQHFVMATRRGEVKRVAVSEFAVVRSSGLIAMGLEADDELCWVRLTSPEQHVMLVTKSGQALRFSCAEVRVSARASGGIRGIRLAPNDGVAGFDVVRPGADLLLVTARGAGKRTPFEQFPTHHRGGGGVRALAVSDRVGPVAAVRSVLPTDEVMLVSAEGLVIRTSVAEISRRGRAAGGVQVMDLNGGDTFVALARLRGSAGQQPYPVADETAGGEEAPEVVGGSPST